jgi:hypothetical protein
LRLPTVHRLLGAARVHTWMIQRQYVTAEQLKI